MNVLSLQKLILCFMVVNFAYADIPLTELAGMSTCMKPGYELYAPAMGALYWYSPFVRNLYEYGPEESAMVQLVKQLFFVHQDNIAFDVTYSPTKVARYFEPTHVGQILGYLNLYSKKLESLNENLDKLIKGIVQDKTKEIKTALVQQSEKTVARHQKEAKSLLDKLITDPENDLPQEKIAPLQSASAPDLNLKKIRDLLKPFQKKSQIQEFFKTINLLSQLQGELKKEVKSADITNVHLLAEVGIKTKSFVQERALADLLVTALHEEQKQLYPEGTIAGLLLAWLWKHSNTKDDVETYLTSFAVTLDKTTQDVFDKEKLMTHPYSQTTYEDLKQKSPNAIKQLSLEELLFAYHGYDLYGNPLPPIIYMTSGVKTICTETFADCGETSLRNFFNALLYNPTAITPEKFDAALLEKLKARSSLIEFYKKYKSTENIALKESHNEWGTVVSGLPQVNYGRAGGCEINAGVANMLKVIGNLIPGIATFEDLKAILKKQNIDFDYSWAIPLDAKSDNVNKLTINIKKPNISAFELSWVFKPLHFEMDYPVTQFVTYRKTYRDAILILINQLNEKILQWPLIILDAQFGQDINILLKAFRGSVNPLQICLTSNTTSWQDKLNFAKIIAQHMEPTVRNPILLKIYAKLPDDIHELQQFYREIGSVIAKDPELLKGILDSSKTEVQKAITIDQILKLAIQTGQRETQDTLSLYDWIKKTLPTLTNDLTRQHAIKSILDIGIARDEFDSAKALYTWVQNTLPMIKNDHFKSDIIKSILNLAIPVDDQARELMKLLYTGIQNSLSSFHDDWNKYETIQVILKFDSHAVAQDQELIKPLHIGIQNTLPTLQDESNKIKAIQLIIEKIISTGPVATELVKPLYMAIQNTLPTLQNERNKINAIQLIFDMDIPAEQQARELVQPLFMWVRNTLPALEKNNAKLMVIKWIFEITIPDDAQAQQLLKILYSGIFESLKTIPEKSSIIKSIVGKKNMLQDMYSSEQWQQIEQWAQ